MSNVIGHIDWSACDTCVHDDELGECDIGDIDACLVIEDDHVECTAWEARE